MIPWESISRQFEESLGYIQADLFKIRTGEPVNYTAALLISCACEIIAKRRLGASSKANDVFRELLPPKQEYRLIGATLYDAIRNGLVHGFDTQKVAFKKGHITVTIAWKIEPHLSVIEGRDSAPSLVLNMQDLADKLSGQIDLYREELKGSAEARDRFYSSWLRDERTTVHTEDVATAWGSVIGQKLEPLSK